MSDRKQNNNLWKNCFIGRDAVTYFLTKDYVNSRHGGLLLGRKLVQKGYVKYAGKEERDFEDEIMFYQFTNKEQEKDKSKSKDKKEKERERYRIRSERRRERKRKSKKKEKNNDNNNNDDQNYNLKPNPTKRRLIPSLTGPDSYNINDSSNPNDDHEHENEHEHEHDNEHEDGNDDGNITELPSSVIEDSKSQTQSTRSQTTITYTHKLSITFING